MMPTITLQPQNEQQMRLIKQLAKTLDIEVTVDKTAQKETLKQKKEREFLDSFERRAEAVKAHLRGDTKLQSIDDFLNEL